MKYFFITIFVLIGLSIGLVITDGVIGVSKKITYPAIITNKTFAIDTIVDDTIQLYPGPTTISIGSGLYYDILTSDTQIKRIEVDLYIPYLNEYINWDISMHAFNKIQIGDTVRVKLGYTDFLNIRKQILLEY